MQELFLVDFFIGYVTRLDFSIVIGGLYAIANIVFSVCQAERFSVPGRTESAT